MHPILQELGHSAAHKEIESFDYSGYQPGPPIPNNLTSFEGFRWGFNQHEPLYMIGARLRVFMEKIFVSLNFTPGILQRPAKST